MHLHTYKTIREKVKMINLLDQLHGQNSVYFAANIIGVHVCKYKISEKVKMLQLKF